MGFIPTPKVATAGIIGAVTYLVLRILSGGFHITVTGEDGAAITTVAAFFFSYFAPRSKTPTP